MQKNSKPGLRKRIFEIIQVGNKEDVLSRGFDFFIVVMIFINIASLIFETFEQSLPYTDVLYAIELVTTTIFAVEYAFRFWTADFLFPDDSPSKARFKFFISFYGIIDLLSFLPFFLPLFFPSGIVAFRLFRVVRIFRFFRINSQYDAFNIIADVISEKKNQLFSSMMIILMLMMASSMMMYNLEHAVQPENFSNAFSGIWWSVSAVLTVGYGDIYPITLLGRIAAIFISFLGVMLVSIPTGIISAGFVEKYSSTAIVSAYDKIFEADNVMELNNDMIMTFVEEDHSFVEKKISEIIMPPGLQIAVIKRKDKMFIPDENSKILAGDYMIIQTCKKAKAK